MSTLNDYRQGDVVYHSTPSGIKYVGVVAGFVDDKLHCWWWMPSGVNYEGYWAQADASPNRVERIGALPEDVEWDVE